MTETVGIRQDVAIFDYHSTRQLPSHFLPSASGTLPYKRKILDRWTKRITASISRTFHFILLSMPAA